MQTGPGVSELTELPRIIRIPAVTLRSGAQQRSLVARESSVLIILLEKRVDVVGCSGRGLGGWSVTWLVGLYPDGIKFGREEW